MSNTDSAHSTFEKETLLHKSVLYQAAFSLLGTQGEAEDAVQETYYQAWKSFRCFKLGTNCRAWMFCILFNVVRNQRRWTFRFLLTNDDSVFDKTVSAFPPALTDELTDPQILAALRRLPRNYAEAVILCDVQEFSYNEISNMIGRPVGTVMSRVSRGRRLLRRSLAGVAEQRGILRTSTVIA